MSHARREQREKERVSPAVTAAVTGNTDDAKRKAVLNVVQVWLDRLQLISTITTFFAGIDGTILSFAIALSHASVIPMDQWSTSVSVLMASLVGSLIFHTCAAITSFTASFVLIRYRLLDIRDYYHMGDGLQPSNGSPSANIPAPISEKTQVDVRFQRVESSPSQMEASHSKIPTAGTQATANLGTFVHNAERNFTDFLDAFQNIAGTKADVESRVFIHQVRPLWWFVSRSRSKTNNGTYLDPPIKLLSVCHTLSVTMASLGFVLVALGILVFAWVALPSAVSIFSSVCLGACLVAVFGVVTFC
ncbi:hypothetical protein BDY19DRAFT_944620 [Irpex rosettiformis]|uniref:Uncharacterized protein n=1 Tax=Irpex rosettiformis TaxID=378272 RepID=A0ACB8U4S6_9APHY|nr:hypothetical protein BDY19DRAFT_944620 [Irpex rosettiformis]